MATQSDTNHALRLTPVECGIQCQPFILKGTASAIRLRYARNDSTVSGVPHSAVGCRRRLKGTLLLEI